VDKSQVASDKSVSSVEVEASNYLLFKDLLVDLKVATCYVRLAFSLLPSG